MRKFVSLDKLSYFLGKIREIFVGAAENTTEGHIVTFGADGRTITDSGHTIDGLMSKADRSKLEGVAANAQVNVIESVKVNGTAVSVTDKAVNIDLSGYATDSELEQYAKKTDISTAFRYKGTVENYAKLPTNAELGDVYNITASDSTNNIKAGDNVVWNGTEWDNLSGILDLDIEEVTNAEIDALFA